MVIYFYSNEIHIHIFQLIVYFYSNMSSLLAVSHIFGTLISQTVATIGAHGLTNAVLPHLRNIAVNTVTCLMSGNVGIATCATCAIATTAGITAIVQKFTS